jgi:hypothetical protein
MFAGKQARRDAAGKQARQAKVRLDLEGGDLKLSGGLAPLMALAEAEGG